MGLNFMEIDPITHLTSPLKGEEQDKLALMRTGGNPDSVWRSHWPIYGGTAMFISLTSFLLDISSSFQKLN